MNTKHQYIQLLIAMRLRKLHQEGFEQVRFHDLERIFAKMVFRRQKPKFLNQLTDRILNITTDEVIRYLSVEATMNTDAESLDALVKGVFNEN